jgi:MYXO-CTERM domain-containing protein
LRKFLPSLMAVTSLSLVLMVPAFAENTANHAPGHTTSTNATDGTYNGVTTRTGPGMGPYGTTGTYGTYGVDGSYGAYDSTRMNGYRPYNTARATTRALATTTTRNFDWGWLGLLGLFGLAGMRSRNRDEVK